MAKTPAEDIVRILHHDKDDTLFIVAIPHSRKRAVMPDAVYSDVLTYEELLLMQKKINRAVDRLRPDKDTKGKTIGPLPRKVRI